MFIVCVCFNLFFYQQNWVPVRLSSLSKHVQSLSHLLSELCFLFICCHIYLLLQRIVHFKIPLKLRCLTVEFVIIASPRRIPPTSPIPQSARQKNSWFTVFNWPLFVLIQKPQRLICIKLKFSLSISYTANAPWVPTFTSVYHRNVMGFIHCCSQEGFVRTFQIDDLIERAHFGKSLFPAICVHPAMYFPRWVSRTKKSLTGMIKSGHCSLNNFPRNPCETLLLNLKKWMGTSSTNSFLLLFVSTFHSFHVVQNPLPSLFDHLLVSSNPLLSLHVYHLKTWITVAKYKMSFRKWLWSTKQTNMKHLFLKCWKNVKQMGKKGAFKCQEKMCENSCLFDCFQRQICDGMILFVWEFSFSVFFITKWCVWFPLDLRQLSLDALQCTLKHLVSLMMKMRNWSSPSSWNHSKSRVVSSLLLSQPCFAFSSNQHEWFLTNQHGCKRKSFHCFQTRKHRARKHCQKQQHLNGTESTFHWHHGESQFMASHLQLKSILRHVRKKSLLASAVWHWVSIQQSKSVIFSKQFKSMVLMQQSIFASQSQKCHIKTMRFQKEHLQMNKHQKTAWSVLWLVCLTFPMQSVKSSCHLKHSSLFFFFSHQLFHQSIHHFVHFNREPLPIDVGKYVVKDLCLSSYLHDLLMPTILSMKVAGSPVEYLPMPLFEPFPMINLLFDFSIDVQAIGLVTQFEPLKTVQNGTLKISVKLSEQYKEWNNPRFTVQCLIQVKNLECSVFSGFSYDLPLYVNILMPMLRLCAKVLAIFDFKCFADVHLVCFFSPLFSSLTHHCFCF